MAVPVMNVRRVRVAVSKCGMRVCVRVRLASWVSWVVSVLMVLVVLVAMCVRQRLMHVVMSVSFGEMHPESEAHEGGGGKEQWSHLVVPEQKSAGRTHEGSKREVRARSRRPQRAHRE